MSDKKDEDGSPSKRPPDSPASAAKRLKDRVSFFEKVWTGTHRSSEESVDSSIDVNEIERRLEEERKRHVAAAQLEHVTLRHTPLSSPKRVVVQEFVTTSHEGPVDVQELEKRLDDERKKFYSPTQLEHVQLRHTQVPQQIVHHHRSGDSGNFEETFVKATEEGDLASGIKMVKFERITVKKSTRELTQVRTMGSRTPSEERILEDSAYHSHGNGVSKSSSVTSLTGRFPSEESLRRTPSKENVKDDWDTASSSSKTTSGSEWYNEYKTESFLKSGTKLEYVRSKSQYDSHIAEIRGTYLLTLFLSCRPAFLIRRKITFLLL